MDDISTRWTHTVAFLTCVSESRMVGRGSGWGAGQGGTGLAQLWVAAVRMLSNLSILSNRSSEPLAKISSTMAIDPAKETGPTSKQK